MINLLKKFSELRSSTKGKLIKAIGLIINSVDYEKSKDDIHFYLDQMWKEGRIFFEFSLNIVCVRQIYLEL